MLSPAGTTTLTQPMAAPTEPKRCALTPTCDDWMVRRRERESHTIPPTSHLEVSLCCRWLPLIFQLVCCGARLNSRAPALFATSIKDTDMKSRFCRPCVNELSPTRMGNLDH